MVSLLLLFMEASEEDRRERIKYLRCIRDNFSLTNIPDNDFESTYRLNKTLFEQLCQDIVPLMSPKKTRRGIDPVMKILTALNFFARGSYQGSVGLSSDGPMAQMSVSRCISEVTEALNKPHILAKYIKFPQNEQARNAIKIKFYNKFRIPGVMGCIDCTHIAIVRPSDQEERCFNRKHYHSLNVQAICDSDCYFLNVNAQYGGATHDSFIWNNCDIKSHMESLHGESYLLGDSGYAQRVYMMTPIDNPIEGSPERYYNFIQKKARATVERAFGILKGRWRCLLAARELHYAPQKAANITLACCVLHNMCIRAGHDAPMVTEEEWSEETRRQDSGTTATRNTISEALERGRRARSALVNLLEQNR